VQQNHTILVASRDPMLADTRKRLLEAAGYQVIPVNEPAQVAQTCTERAISLLIIGYSLARSQKRRIWQEARKHCKVPVLELYQGGGHELIPDRALFVHDAQAPDDFLGAVQQILHK
jgi:DNA-binding response OmpR family regulator